MSQCAAKLLIIDDDREIAELCDAYLSDRGYAVTFAGTAAEGLRNLSADAFDVIVLDVKLPDGNGFDLAPQIRARSSARILFLTVLDDPLERVTGLELGDEYLTKPFDMRELQLRVEMLLRKAEMPSRIDLRPLRLDVLRRRAFLDDAPLSLTATEFTLLLCLARTPNVTVRFADLASAGWPGELVNTATIVSHISALRSKLSGAPGHYFFIENNRRQGYRLLSPPKKLTEK